MAFKLIAIFALAAIASSAPIEEYQHEQYVAAPVQHQIVAAPAHHQIVAAAPAYKHVEYENAPAQYEFNYEVHDEHTGDIKSQKETRNGDNVQGYYTIVDADGYRRIVEYTADEHHGFNAVVRREPIEGFKAPVVQQYKQQSEHSNYHY